MEEEERLSNIIAKAKQIYSLKAELYCPYFQQKILLTAEGFYHLQRKPNGEPRNIREQILKLSLLKSALEIIPKVGTLQEHRIQIEKDTRSGKKGFYKTQKVEYWAFHAILRENQRRIKIILRRVGDGNIAFWSVMPFDQKPWLDEDSL